ncbi:MAG: DUF2071 domain-containing protein [Candidatus Obscuribacter sp.]|nr:DUF2071 domain-containing protein [Candidatus Obscuribacter sp.]
MLRAARLLEFSLLATIVAHGLGLLSIVCLLMPGLPGGPLSDAERISFIAGHPLIWRLGWLPWQVTAVSDLLLGLSLLRTSWIPKLPALTALLATIVAVSIEQPGEYRWITEGVELCQKAVAGGSSSAYLEFEKVVMVQISAWAALAYTLAAVAWTFAFGKAKTWSRALTWLSVVTWSTMFAAALAPISPVIIKPSAFVVAQLNALGFALMMIWFVLVFEVVLRRSRPEAPFGGMSGWRYPGGGIVGAALNMVANSRALRYVGEMMPFTPLVSDIENVVYINYLVEASQLERLLPYGLELQRLGPDGRYALFTMLTFRHGRFGPKVFGPLRGLCFSPIQSNWRIHVRHGSSLGVYFVSTVISHTAMALVARILSGGVPMHVPERAVLEASKDNVHLTLAPGSGSGPDLEASLCASTVATLPPPWSDCFTGFEDFLAYCVPQDRAVFSQPWYGRLIRQEISLGIPLTHCKPLNGKVQSRFADSITGGAMEPLVFQVASVAFKFNSIVIERLLDEK